METRKLHCIGMVQGVGFRWSIQLLAQKMHITGTVKNNSDGTVTIIAQGSKELLDKFTEKIPEAAHYAVVSRIDTEILPETRKMHSFSVVY